MKLYQKFARTLQAYITCVEKGNDYSVTHKQTMDSLVRGYLPSGSGFDVGCKLDTVNSTPERLIFHTSFHHINENGMYAGWSAHKVIVTPSLAFGLNIKVTGRDKNEIKDYIAESFHLALDKEITQ